MFTYVPYFFFLSNLLFIVTDTAENPPYTPTDHILLSCGSPSSSISSDGRTWSSDASSKFSSSNMASISSAVTATEQHPSVPQVPYLTARITRSQFSYTFFVSPGKKFLRLHFYPASYSYSYNLSITESYFAVTANKYLLLSNFSAFLAVSVDFSLAFVVKEFIINVQDSQFLNVTFLPSSNSFAFVNGIEVVSTPDNLYMGNRDLPYIPVKNVNCPNIQFELDQNNTAFETLYRFNVGGISIAAVDDTGMFREWHADDNFVWGADTGNPMSNNQIAVKYTSQTQNYTAPPIVYTTGRAMGLFSARFNLTWIFPVDSGFNYLLRLHFCEINPDIITKENQRVFIIYISNRTAEPDFDVIFWTGGPGIPIFRDYVVFVPNPPGGRQTKQDLFLALHPNLDVHPEYEDAILNGLEIFKLSSSDGSRSLAGTNPDPHSPAPNTNPPVKKKSSGKSRVLFAVIGGVLGAAAVVLILALGLLIFRRRRGVKEFDQKFASKFSWLQLSTPSRSTKTRASGTSSLPSDLCKRFLLEEIRSATANFNANFVIGTGGFGHVYKGCIDNNLSAVAIKRLNPLSSQGAREFQSEIEMLSKLKHRHLVSLIGYCYEKGEMILVYDYMANGTLRDHLYKTKNPPLTWIQRLQICIGAAKGLQYLHAGAKHNIIHRDVKSTNILLDEKWVAKVSDFGLSKLGPSGGIHSHISTQVKGSVGYVDPEYRKRQQLTDKSDVYSFGVVLFEVLCGRAAIIPKLPKEQAILAEWAKGCHGKGTIDQIVDPNVMGEIAPECLRSFAETAINCLNDLGIERPEMNDVVWRLEFALQLQEAADKGGGRPPFPTLIIHGGGGGDMGTAAEDDADVFSESRGDQDSAAMSNNHSITTGTSTASSDKLKSDSVFSEIMNPTAR